MLYKTDVYKKNDNLEDGRNSAYFLLKLWIIIKKYIYTKSKFDATDPKKVIRMYENAPRRTF